MPDSPARQAEIAVEQAQVDRVYARVAEIRAEARAMRDRGYELAHGAAREAIFEQATMLHERDVLVQHTNRLLAALDAEHEGLVFGRLDLEYHPAQGPPGGNGGTTGNGGTAAAAGLDAAGLTDDELEERGPLYIGRMGIRDADFRGLVTDWRAPAAAAFYRATAQDPMGVLRRRVIRCSGETVLDVDDDLLTSGPVPDGITVVGEGALMAALGRTRGDTMHDIVATIQREQDEVIRAPAAGVTEIVGGPGTGKTAVALHRVAYLLYAERRRFGGAGVLVIGPSPVFMSYIARVLPAMGEDTAQLRALGEVLDGVTATRIDPPAVAAIKGSLRMVRLLRRAVRAAPAEAPNRLRITYQGEVLTLDAADLARVRRLVHSRGGSANRIRVRAAEELLEALWRKAERYADERFRPKHKELVTELGERIDFHRFVVTWWPPLVPAEILAGLGDRDRLAEIGRGVLEPHEVDLLAESWRRPGLSVADVALLDELRVFVGEPRRRRGQPAEPLPGAVHGRNHYDEYAHVVIDEAQDLSPMQWRMIGRRGRFASWTVVGDPVQSSWPDPRESAQARDAALGRAGDRRYFTLRTNYRNSVEIFTLAAKVLGDLVPAADLPVAVRSSGIEPVILDVAAEELPSATRRAAAELLAAVEGTVGVISAMERADDVRGWLDGLDTGPVDRLRPVGSLESKGMEYDAVVVVEPAEMVEESSTGRRALYVALTRATQQLTVLTTRDSWLP
ncbi:MAG TPA: ATP-binding domain-containing protein [Pseudonocardiaceae bacterium]